MRFLNMTIPVIQGGMGVGVSLGGLAGAVARQGGAGTISTAQIGYRDADFFKNPLGANLRAIGTEIEKARRIACGNGAVGVNIMVVTQNYDEYVKAAVDAGADYIISGAGLPMKLPALTKGTDVKIIPIVSSKKAAMVICKRWLKKDGRIPDAVIIEGPKAGGHLGFTEKYMEESVDYNDYEKEIQSIIKYLREFGEEQGTYIPVFTAGGYRTKEDLKHQLSLGADGIQIATPLVTTVECDAHEAFKMAYINCNKEDICIIKSPVGMPGRAIRNKFVEQTCMEQSPKQQDINKFSEQVVFNKPCIRKCYNCISVCNPAETPYCITQALIRSVTGDVENGLIFCGADVWKEDRIRTVKEVLEAFRD